MKEPIEDGRQQRSSGRRHKFPFFVLGGFKELAYVHIDHETCVVIGSYAHNTYSVLKLSSWYMNFSSSDCNWFLI